ncbi:division/cell wall cluster transcriptional repressor MraZ [Acidithiobacillus sp. CV18-2]|uniref:Transcriptional regulator MraZ n=1 Tax=Igneacidithiobacillus copahuensis TaxID=2724909 RepID=A0AAE2YPU0_9PROT|nr:division/cell wall cluster transcriptional repressor MraZ [Igneacidithiobacillus copahuensis]MBU2755497.1 division/cell wall cluster transcriptional repressor MraZ [Acidithiobacillus sp. CV18-3]MBU2757832.1 division/cell wall cluster transcriptional repressor MraZ [Acidithiobacillus sp. BN09-2]MBU2777903.1 division/cell wall cluster transcriptional repressor MraZ [Acidithiobacillus sp. CV18-2]MBU2797829.1 division/cell wall cluster transcriptional repressor MraZ [Acidithiobacillus sp. VAN18-
MFRGTHCHTLDSKGRLSVPARFRDQLNALCDGQIVLTINPTNEAAERCLWAYPLPRWEEVERQVAALPSTQASVRRFQRLFIGHSEELRLDNQSRILLSANLRQYAQIERDVVLVGQVSKFEIWDAELWQQQQTLSPDEDLLASLGDLQL